MSIRHKMKKTRDIVLFVKRQKNSTVECRLLSQVDNRESLSG